MAGRYVLTPARRAALKKAQAKSAAKRRGRGAHRVAKRQAANKSNTAYRKNPTRSNLKRQRANYDRAVNDSRVKNKGKKYRSDRYLKNKRRAVTTATNVAIVAASTAPQLHVAYLNNKYKREDPARKRAKAAKKQYKEDRSQSLKARKRNLANAGLKPDGSVGKRRKPVKVQSSRARGPQFSSQKAIGAAPKKRKRTGANTSHRR